ncbi:MAG: hypothetical protein AAF571_13235 [Verrucomicrobiota bacterium]
MKKRIHTYRIKPWFSKRKPFLVRAASVSNARKAAAKKLPKKGIHFFGIEKVK